MKIQIKLDVSESTGTRECDLEDLGVTKEEWDFYSEDAKREALQDYLNDLDEQPYWCVDSFGENEDEE